MSNRVYELFFIDIIIAILKLKDTASRYDSAQNLLFNYNDWDSVIREFEIIGEATNNLIKNNFLDEKNRSIVDFRNVLIHEYFGIEAEEVWDILQNHLDEFYSTVLQKFSQIDENLKIELIDDFIQENKHLKFIVNTLEGLKNE